MNDDEPTPAEEIGRMLRQIDRTKIRRRSVDMDAPKFLLDRNQVARLMLLAYAIEKKTYRHREKGAHRGALGGLAIELLKVLMGFGVKHGRIFPSLAKLSYALRRCEDTITTALGRLIDQGFVTKHRRSKKIGTPQGDRRVQDSNAYEIHMPGENVGAARIPGLLAPLASDPKISGVPVQQTDIQNNDGRFWLTDPYRMPDGSWT
jgi:hypothetical protein